MTRSKLGFKAFCSSMLILGLMAVFSTGIAQTETGASWALKTSGGTLIKIPGPTDLLPTVQVQELEFGVGALHFTTGGGTLVEIVCTSAELLENMKLVASGGVSLGKARFAGCKTYLNGVLNPLCKPFTGASSGVIESLKATGLIILHSGSPLVRITPDTGNVFAHILLGEECPIGEEILVSGSLTLEDAGNLATESSTRLMLEGPLSSLTALGQPAELVALVVFRLTGAHSGLAWGGLAA
jgi:hypothetical protein